ncbi:hypothetical protein BDN72DRAFT_862055 [Pluteus cervinus]|uniref:Uncharacterized protein n=1 Tax=Pluteus cervinus TaxID=181527 RepID=A0ACD3ACX7_9AGAR|nr:hypothetical protein BDN72DRAFT_862055 [Pluteus cervinus]
MSARGFELWSSSSLTITTYFSGRPQSMDIMPLILPEELQLMIFEYAAEDLDTALSLCYVSRSVQYCVLPFLYRWITFYAGHNDKKRMRELRRKFAATRYLHPPLADDLDDFTVIPVAPFVKSICVDYSTSHSTTDLIRIISDCTSLTHFATFEQPEPPVIPLHLLTRIPTLRSLAGDLGQLFNQAAQPIFCNEIFSQLTHLSVGDLWHTWTRWEWASFLPYAPLTHLALAYTPFIFSPTQSVDELQYSNGHHRLDSMATITGDTTPTATATAISGFGFDTTGLWANDPNVVSVLQQILSGVKNLKVCVLAIDYVVVWQSARPYDDRLDDRSVEMMSNGDYRLVGLSCRNPIVDWNPGLGTAEDNFWKRAEDKMMRKRIEKWERERRRKLLELGMDHDRLRMGVARGGYEQAVATTR